MRHDPRKHARAQSKPTSEATPSGSARSSRKETYQISLQMERLAALRCRRRRLSHVMIHFRPSAWELLVSILCPVIFCLVRSSWLVHGSSSRLQSGLFSLLMRIAAWRGVDIPLMMQKLALLNDRNSTCQSCPGGKRCSTTETSTFQPCCRGKRDVEEMSCYIVAHCWRQTLPLRGSVVPAKSSPRGIHVLPCHHRHDYPSGRVDKISCSCSPAV